jgi:hypothetical protein
LSVMEKTMCVDGGSDNSILQLTIVRG